MIGFSQDGCIGSVVGDYVYVTIGHRTGQLDDRAGVVVAVEVHLQLVSHRTEIDRGSGAVIDLDGLAVRATFDVLGDEQLL